MELSVIIVNWNSKELLRKCIASILAETKDLDFEIVVIDAGSYDGCREMLGENFPQVRFIQSDKNLGFAKANNVAFESSRGQNLLFLNPDTEVVGAAINKLMESLRSLPRAGAIGARLLNSDKTLQTSCVQSVPTLLNQLLSSDYLRNKWPNSSLWGMSALYANGSAPDEVEAISGACILTTRAAFEKVGRFAEDYFMYAEDIDLCHKLRKAGFRNYYVPTAEVIHHGGSSSDQVASSFNAVMAREAMWRFFRKWRGRAASAAYRVCTLAGALGRLVVIKAIAVSRGGSTERVDALLEKWMEVVRWSLNCDSIVRQYYRS